MNPVIHIVDDDRLARESLRWLVETASLDVEEFTCGQAFLDKVNDECCGCIVLDVRMPDINGMDLFTRINRAGITLPVIIVTGHADVAMAVRAMKSGAYDFVEKPYNDALMLERVQSAITFDMENRKSDRQMTDLQNRFDLLTPRENQVLERILQSQQNKTIANELQISIKTVELHRANLMTKMQVSSATELVRLAIHAQLVN